MAEQERIGEAGKAEADGKNATASFVSGLYKAVPPLKDVFDMAGMDLRNYSGKKNGGSSDTDVIEVKMIFRRTMKAIAQRFIP